MDYQTILEKVKAANEIQFIGESRRREEILNTMLTTKCSNKLLAINYAIGSSHKNRERCTKIIIPYHDDSDAEHIFLPCLQLGDMDLARELLTRLKGDDELLQRVLKAEDKDGYNCFHLVYVLFVILHRVYTVLS